MANRDRRLLPRTLPSWLALGSDDVLIAADHPVDSALKDDATTIATSLGVPDSIKFIEVSADDRYRFHQAHVRRAGFLEAKHDAILTGDIDLVVKKSMVPAIAKVGTNGIGLVSFSKIRVVTSAAGAYRAVAFLLKQKLLPPKFVGLYAFWRPYWSETEDDGIRYLKNPRTQTYQTAGLGILGEENYLYICMKRSYRCLHINSAYALDLTGFVEDLPSLQFEWGRVIGESVGVAAGLVASETLAYPNLLRGCLAQRREKGRFVDVFANDFDWKELVSR